MRMHRKLRRMEKQKFGTTSFYRRHRWKIKCHPWHKSSSSSSSPPSSSSSSSPYMSLSFLLCFAVVIIPCSHKPLQNNTIFTTNTKLTYHNAQWKHMLPIWSFHKKNHDCPKSLGRLGFPYSSSWLDASLFFYFLFFIFFLGGRGLIIK